MLTEILISGFGGQGVLFAGKLLAHSALENGLELSWLPSYGPEMRGGTANCSVCISDEPIGSPLVTNPDILIAMNEPSVEKFESSVKPGGIIFTDSSLSDRKIIRTDIICCETAASDIARKNDLNGMSNMILLGRVIKECSSLLAGISVESLVQSLQSIIPSKKISLAKKNIAALNIGYSF